jgi:sortase A
MKKLLILVLFFGIVIGYLFVARHPQEPDSAPILGQTTQQKVIQSPTPTIEASKPDIPTHLSIPSLSVEADIESVGLDSKRAMDVPKDFMNAGWYKLGARPGEIGSAVLAGHVDTPTGAPAIFARIHTLDAGDEIVMTDETGRTYTFAVTDTKTFPYDQVPIAQVFDDRTGKNLNLITCSGTWDKVARNYSTRTIVYAQMK